jgi:hypothetical protein
VHQANGKMETRQVPSVAERESAMQELDQNDEYCVKFANFGSDAL